MKRAHFTILARVLLCNAKGKDVIDLRKSLNNSVLMWKIIESCKQSILMASGLLSFEADSYADERKAYRVNFSTCCYAPYSSD